MLILTIWLVSRQFDRKLFRSRVHSIETNGQFQTDLENSPMEQWQEDEEVVDDGLVNEEGLYDNLEDRLNEKKRMDALFLLQTEEANRLTQKATDNIMQGATALVKNTVELLRMGAQNRLDSAGLRFEAVPGLTELFNDEHVISNPFRHVNTEYK